MDSYLIPVDFAGTGYKIQVSPVGNSTEIIAESEEFEIKPAGTKGKEIVQLMVPPCG
jgi:hypothetical protein